MPVAGSGASTAPASDASHKRPPLPASSAGYLAIMIAMVVGAVVLLEWTFGSAPMPPGVDPGHWSAVADAYVGLPYPPAGAVGSPYVDPPVPFVILGSLIRLAGNPLTADFAFAGLLLGLYGLSVIHLARRFLLTGPLQVAFVGVAVFNGTTLTMLFWGGYPNFLGFVWLNEAVVFLLAFVRSASVVDSVGFYGFSTLVFLTHDLTFAVLLGVVGASAAFLAVHRKVSLRFLVGRANLAGAAVLIAVVAGYVLIGRFLGIVHPGYLYSNPAAFVLDNLGQVFNPITANCAACIGDNLDPLVALAILLTVPVVLLGVLVWIREAAETLPTASPAEPGTLAPARVPASDGVVDTPTLLAAAWISGACLVPALGYVFHVDTDYSRFGYFFPLPVLLLISIVADRAVNRSLRPAPAAATSSDPSRGTSSTANPSSTRSKRPLAIASGATAVAIVLLLVFSTLPIVSHNETAFTGITHGSPFLDAIAHLKSNPQSGAVLTVTGATRWVQGLAARAAFDYGPTWVLFYPWQILNAQESYWALNGRYALSNNHVSFLYSGYNTSTLLEAPEYLALFEGLVYPILRVAPGSLLVTTTSGGVLRTYAPGSWGGPSLVVPSGSNNTGRISFTGPIFGLNETDQLGQSGGAWINFSIAPRPSVQINAFSFGLVGPATQDPVVKGPPFQNVSYSGAQFSWSVAGRLGQLAGIFTFPTTGTVAGGPTQISGVPPGAPSLLTVNVTNPNPTQPFEVSLQVTTPSTSNPAVTLPTVFDTAQFLLSKDIHFVLLPSVGSTFLTSTYYQAEFGFKVAYSNSQWTLLQG